MVDQHGVIKVLDFGIARIVGAGLTEMSMVIGTPGYMSPEQIQGGAIDTRSDIFAVGAVLYELLCYREAFAGDSPHAVMSKVIGADPIPLREFLTGANLSIADVVDRALQKRAEARYPSMTALEVAVRMARLAPRVGPDRSLRGAARPSTRPVAVTAPADGSAGDCAAQSRTDQSASRGSAARARRGRSDAAAAACEAVLLLDPVSPAALGMLDDLKPDSSTQLDTLLREARDAMRAARFRCTSSGSSDAWHRSSRRPPRNPAASDRVCAGIGAARGPARTRRRRCATRARRFRQDHPFSRSMAHSPWQEALVREPTPLPTPSPQRRSPATWIVGALATVALAAGGWWLGASTAQPAPSSLTSETPTAVPALAAEPSQARDVPPPAPAIDVAPVAPTPATPAIEPVPDETPRQPQSLAPASPRPQDSGEALRLAESAERRGDLNQALAHYRDALRINPTNVTAARQIARIRAGYLLRRAESLMEAGDYDAAERDTATAIETDPGNPAAAELLKKITQARAAGSTQTSALLTRRRRRML